MSSVLSVTFMPTAWSSCWIAWETSASPGVDPLVVTSVMGVLPTPDSANNCFAFVGLYGKGFVIVGSEPAMTAGTGPLDDTTSPCRTFLMIDLVSMAEVMACRSFSLLNGGIFTLKP